MKHKMHFELSLLIVWIALWIANTYSKFQVNIFSNDREITKWQYLRDDDYDDAKAIAVSRIFSNNQPS